MQSAKVAIVGFGTIGSGVARLLLESRERISQRVGRPVELVRIVDLDLKRPRNVVVPDDLLSDDLATVLDDPEIEVVIQLIGGVEAARSIMLKLLEAGKDVVTANKALLAEHGAELFQRARTLGRSITFEAAVAGGIPIIAAIGQSLRANRIESIRAILNGTSNFILSRMEQTGADYSASVKEAQRRGYAEADPAMDVDGTDAAQKLSILAQLAFGADVKWRNIPRVGIDTVQVADLQYAGELGYSIKLLAVAELLPDGLELHVSPTLIRHGKPLAEVHGAFNAIQVIGDAVGRVFFQGLGAGQDPTASAVVGDLMDTLVGRTRITFQTLGLWSTETTATVTLRDPAAVSGRYYLRFRVEDRPGVMAEIAGILGHHGISIASLIQHEVDETSLDADQPPDETVPLVIMTHQAVEGAMIDALKTINQLSCIRPETVRMRVRD